MYDPDGTTCANTTMSVRAGTTSVTEPTTTRATD